MKVLIPYWQGRISPLFDSAATVLIVDMDNGRELSRVTSALEGKDPLQRVRQTVSFGAETLICGAISGQLECLLRSTGLQVIANICGSVDEVLHAFARGNLFNEQFFMPGCHGLRQRSRNRRRRQ